MDYEDFSNLNNQDLVPLLESLDKVHKICAENQIPIVICFVPKNDIPSFSLTYNKEFDSPGLDKLAAMTGLIIKCFREHLGIILKYIPFKESEWFGKI